MEERINQFSEYAKREKASFSVNTEERIPTLSKTYNFLLGRYIDKSTSKEELEAISNINDNVNKTLSRTRELFITQKNSKGTPVGPFRPQVTVRDNGRNSLAPYSTLTKSMKGCEDTPGGCTTMGGKTRRYKRRQYKSRRYKSRR
jgi:hypothetical protein